MMPSLPSGTGRSAGIPPPVASRPCAARSLPSGRNCSWGRSSTPTRRGSASNWRCRGSTVTSRRRWVTTSTGSCGSIRIALDRSDAVICCGGLGPTQDDLTRQAIAAVMGVELVLDEDRADLIRWMFRGRDRHMPDNNLLQAYRPEGAEFLDHQPGTAPGLLCPMGDQVIYAVPGVPWEMQEMIERCVLPDLQRRAGIRSVIRSRTLRTWGQSESGLAEMSGRPHRRARRRSATRRSPSSRRASRASRCG